MTDDGDDMEMIELEFTEEELEPVRALAELWECTIEEALSILITEMTEGLKRNE